MLRYSIDFKRLVNRFELSLCWYISGASPPSTLAIGPHRGPESAGLSRLFRDYRSAEPILLTHSKSHKNLRFQDPSPNHCRLRFRCRKNLHRTESQSRRTHRTNRRQPAFCCSEFGYAPGPPPAIGCSHSTAASCPSAASQQRRPEAVMDLARALMSSLLYRLLPFYRPP